MDDIKKVSIIVPIYNDEKNIRSCINSIIAQTYKNLEIILVDDASRDTSLEICKEYAVSDDRINVLHNSHNYGLSGSREIGYQQATGEWLCFVDHDDCMCSQAIEWLLNFADEKTDIVAGKYKNIPNKNFEQYVWEEVGKPDVLVLNHDSTVDTLGHFGQYGVSECLWGKIYRRELFANIEILEYKERFSQVYFEDVLLTSALFKACKQMKIVDKNIYIHRVDYNSVSMSPYALEFNLQTARTADIVTVRLDEPYSKTAYAKVIQNYLLVFAKNWYLVWQYYDKNDALLQEMENLFNKYYKIYNDLGVKKPFLVDLCIRIFSINKVLFCIIVCRLWFQWISKIKYALKS